MAASLRATQWFTSPSISSSSLNPLPCVKSPFNLHISFHAPTLSPISHHPSPSFKKFNFKLYSAVEEIQVEETQEEDIQQEEESSDEKKRKLFVVNIPWSASVTDIKNLFGECGAVKDVEIIKGKDGKHRGYAFVTMDSPDEAQAVVQKFDSYEFSGRIIRVEFAKRLRKPSPPPPADAPVVETRHKLYVSNLAWKVRSGNLREFFSAEFNPVSGRVVFERPSGGSAGYGFVSFATKEEAEAAIASMDGKELMGRPIRLKFSERNVDGPGSKPEEGSPEVQSDETEATATQPEES